ncbi:hypothetical protein [Microseira sp. BLCC-F43]|uniref:hypothetical protein n=1 Tax=Microseira sp. BLCC-F43 TaxID=3153602 RepID=UPI0035BACB98
MLTSDLAAPDAPEAFSTLTQKAIAMIIEPIIQPAEKPATCVKPLRLSPSALYMIYSLASCNRNITR